MEDVIEDCKHSRHLLIAVLVLLAEHVVHKVKVQFEQLYFRGCLIGNHIDDGLQVEDLGEDASLPNISTNLL